MTPLSLHPAWLRDTLLKAAVLVLATAWIYSPVYHGEFLWDDSVLVTDNWMVQSGSLGGLAAIWAEPDGPDYFPLTYTALWLAWMAFGEDPTGYHLVNIALHTISGLLLWQLLTQLQLSGAWLAALVFSVHPVCVESVAWISEIKNTLSLPFFLLACLYWVRQDEAPTAAARNVWYGWAVLAFLLALLAKPSMVGLPLLTLVYAWWKRQAVSRQDLLRIAPVLLVAVAMGLVTVWYQQERAIGDEVLPIGGPLSRLAVAGMAIAFYLVTIVWPVGLTPVYPQWTVQPVDPWQLLPWLGLAGAALFSWKYRGRWGRHVILAGGFFLLMIAPVLGFVDMAFMTYSWVSDHFLYLPMIGPIAGLVSGITGCLQQQRSVIGGAAVGLTSLLVSGLAGGSYLQATHWVKETVFWTYVVEHNDDAWQAHLELGVACLDRGDIGCARHHFSRAVIVQPDRVETQHCLAVALLKSGRSEQAVTLLERALQGAPHAHKLKTTLLEAYVESHDAAKAKKIAETLLELDPGDYDTRVLYATALFQLGELPAARREFREVLSIDPLNTRAKKGLATAPPKE